MMEDDRRFHKLTQEQVETLDQVLTEVIPIHGRGNFPTLEIKPKDIIHMVRDRLILKKINVRDVRLNGSTASHVLVKENGTSYKDLDIIFGVELPKPEDFQIIKEVVLGSLLDFLPKGVNKDKITALTMKEAYVQKMVKVFNEQDRWSLISLSNNSGKNMELKFVNSLRRQFEFSVDSFQIILDSMLQSYLDAERRMPVEGPNSSLASRLVIQSTLLEKTFLRSCDIGHQEDSNVDVPCKSVDIQTFFDSQCYCEMSQKEESKNSGETNLEIDKDIEMEMVETVTKPESSDKMSEQFVTLLGEEKQELHEDVSLNTLALEVKTNQTDLGVRNEQDVKTMTLKETNTPVKTNIRETYSDKTEYMLAIEPVNAQPLLEMVHSGFSCLSTKGAFGERCSFQPAPITILAQTDSYAEYPLPPPAKKNSHNSHMVVLKHSSPKPPRKMSRKITLAPHSSKQLVSNNSDVNMCQVLHPPEAYSNEELPMQAKLSGLTTKSFELSSASANDSKESEKVATCAGAFIVAAPDNDMQSEHLRVCPNESLQNQAQNSEQETDEATHFPTLIPMSIPNDVPKDQNMIIQPFSEKNQTAQHQAVVPLTNVNSDLLHQENDDSVLLKKEVADPTSPKHLKQSVIKATHFPSEMLRSISADSTVDSQVEVTSLSCHEHIIPTEIDHLNYTVSTLKTQEVLRINPLAGEPPEDLSYMLETLVSLPEVQSLTVSAPHFSKSIEPPMYSTVTDTPRNSEIDLEPPVISADVMEYSDVFLNVLQQSKVLSQSLKPPSVSVSQMLETSVSSEGEKVDSKTPEQSGLDNSKLSSKEPCITVMAESMYGDFEQAMDHLRYRLISTRNPEEIRGGGLLKYSNLLVRDFKPACETEIKTLERYMCSRFFIDFPDVNEQQRKIESYLRNHFIGEEKSKYDYLMTLRRVVNESTVCLMGHERRQTLNMITILALKVLGEQNIIPNANNVTCYYQPAPYMTDHNFSNYYMTNGQSPLIYHPYPLHIQMQTGLV